MSKHWFVVPVNPEPWRVGPVGTGRRDGRPYAYVGRDQQLDAFQQAVAESVREQWGDRPPLEGKIRVRFFFWRQRAAYTTPNQRQHRKHEADATNMQKATEDALQGIVYVNDKDNVSVGSAIMEQSADLFHPLIVICVEELSSDGNAPWKQAILSAMPDDVRHSIHDHLTGVVRQEAAPDPNTYGDDRELF